MKSFVSLIFFAVSLYYSSFAQQKSLPETPSADPQLMKEQMGKNTNLDIDPYTGINSVFIIRIKGLKEQEQFRQFDENLVKQNREKIVSCHSDFSNGITTIITTGSMDISELKTYVYTEGKKVAPPIGVEILDYKHNYQIIKN